jgi:O-antigen/teichoic acid export membrane protein
MVPALVSNVMYPKLAEIYGSTGNLSDLIPLVRMIIKLNFLFTVPIAITFFVVFYLYVIPVYMNAYLSGREAMAIILSGCIFIPVGVGFGDLFNVIGMQMRYLRNTIIGVAVNACTGWWLVAHLGAGLEGAAAGTLVGLAVFTVLQVGTFANAYKHA